MNSVSFDKTSSMDFDLDFVKPEEEEGLDDNEEGKGL